MCVYKYVSLQNSNSACFIAVYYKDFSVYFSLVHRSLLRSWGQSGYNWEEGQGPGSHWQPEANKTEGHSQEGLGKRVSRWVALHPRSVHAQGMVEALGGCGGCRCLAPVADEGAG